MLCVMLCYSDYNTVNFGVRVGNAEENRKVCISPYVAILSGQTTRMVEVNHIINQSNNIVIWNNN